MSLNSMNAAEALFDACWWPDEDTYSLSATKAGKLMANHFLKLRTMAAIVKLGERPNMPSLLRVICSAEEFKNTSLRRSGRNQ